MNRTWHFYNPTTGLFTGRTFSGPDGPHNGLALNTPAGTKAFEAAKGTVDFFRHRIDVTAEKPTLVAYDGPPPPGFETLQRIRRG